MLKLTIPGDPIALMRPRFGRNGNVFDKQKAEKHFVKSVMQSQIAKNGFNKHSNGPLHAEVWYHTTIPKSWPQKKRQLVLDKPDPTRKDIDNLLKFNFDTMNDLVYEDDRQITTLFSRKQYSNNPRVEIIIEKEESNMINEHALTIKNEITTEDLDYMVKKANRLGLKNRHVVRVFMQEDDEGKHYYYECQGIKSLPPNCS